MPLSLQESVSTVKSVCNITLFTYKTVGVDVCLFLSLSELCYPEFIDAWIQ